MSADEYLTLAEPGHAQTRVLGSRFLGHAFAAANVEDLNASLEVDRKQCHDATHWCFAARFGVAPFVLERSSDAGEPKGTAGVPILQQIQNHDLTDCAIIVTRYFGGTKLGTGNLARAYAECAALALQDATTIQRKLLRPMLIECSFDLQSLVYHIAGRFEASVQPMPSLAHAMFQLNPPRSQFAALSAALIEESRGRIEIRDPSQ
jgi:uncharacterized YigZ family protein